MIQLRELHDFATRTADGAARIALDHFRSKLSVDYKADNSPVTMADRSIEAFVREKIAKEYPDHGIFGEEEPPLHVDRKYVWVIDPIDGTKSFVTGHPLFGGLIGLLEDGRPCLGQIDMPVLGERYFAADGQPTLMNGAPCRTSGCTQLSETFAYTTDPLLFSGQRQSALDLLQQKARLIRFGGDCYCYALMAAGHCDLVLETGLQPYDYLPVVKIVQEAGGVITDWSGASLNVASNGDVVAAATPELHAAILERLHPLSRELAT